MSTPTLPNPSSAKHGTGKLPTDEDTKELCLSIGTNIKAALRDCVIVANYRTAGRELSLTRTKLEEALMWLKVSPFYTPADDPK